MGGYLLVQNDAPPSTDIIHANKAQEQRQAPAVSNAADQGASPPPPKASPGTPANQPASDPDEADVSLDPEQVLVGDNPEFPTLQSRLTEMHARREGREFAPAEVLAAIEQDSAWEADDSLADQFQLSDEDRYDGRVFIDMNPLKIESLMPGDTMEIPIQQDNATYQMVVEAVEEHGDGSVTWRGQLEDFPEDNQVMITQSEGVTHGSVFTPRKPWVIQAYGNAGWVVASGTLFKGGEKLIDPADELTGAGASEPHTAHDHSAHPH